MSQSPDQLLEQLDGLGTALTAVLNRLGQIELEMAAAKNEANLQISAIRDFLNDPQISALAGPDPAAGADVGRANEAIQKLSVGETQEQILEIFLEEVNSLSDRAILFLQRGDSYFAWKGLGFDSSIFDSVQAESDEDPIRRSAREQRIIYRTDDLTEAFPWLTGAGEVPETAVCVPLIFEETAPVVLYVDSSHGIELDSLELLSHLAVLVLKNHYLMARLEGSTADAEKETATLPSEPLEMPLRDFEGVSASSLEAETVEAEASPDDLAAFETEVGEVEELLPPESESEEPVQASREPAAEDEDEIEDLADGLALEEADGLAIEEADGLAIEEADGLAIEEADGLAIEEADGLAIEEADGLAIEEADGLAIEEADGLAIEEADGLAIEEADGLAIEEADGLAVEQLEDAAEPEEASLESKPTGWSSLFVSADGEPDEAPEVVAEGAEPVSEEMGDVPSLGTLLRSDDPVGDVLTFETGTVGEETLETSDDGEVVEDTEIRSVPDVEWGETLESEPQPELDEEGERRHSEARRFARLLVSEIKLYHEDRVKEGRQNQDIYERLQRDIDRSRDMYDRRADATVKTTHDYFHAELIRILAEGDEAQLGSGYPGPMLSGSD